MAEQLASKTAFPFKQSSKAVHGREDSRLLGVTAIWNRAVGSRQAQRNVGIVSQMG